MSEEHGGRTVIVTGAAFGIGRAVARRLADQGARVVGVDVNAGELRETARLLNEAGYEFTEVVADVGDTEHVEHILAAAPEAYGLVNNAGVMDFFLPVGDVDDETWRRVLGVNVDGPMRLTRAVIGGMRERARGSIVNIASIAGLGGGAAGVAYTVSKHALIGLTRSTAYFYGPDGVRCNVICPAGVRTGIGSTAVPKVEWAWERLQPSFGRGQRVAEPEEIASLVSWLLSDEAINVNGAVIASDGGWTAA